MDHLRASDSDLQSAADEFDAAFNNSVLVSPEVAAFLLTIVDSVNYTVTAATIEAQAALIVQAKRELGGGC